MQYSWVYCRHSVAEYRRERDSTGRYHVLTAAPLVRRIRLSQFTPHRLHTPTMNIVSSRTIRKLEPQGERHKATRSPHTLPTHSFVHAHTRTHTHAYSHTHKTYLVSSCHDTVSDRSKTRVAFHPKKSEAKKKKKMEIKEGYHNQIGGSCHGDGMEFATPPPPGGQSLEDLMHECT